MDPTAWPTPPAGGGAAPPARRCDDPPAGADATPLRRVYPPVAGSNRGAPGSLLRTFAHVEARWTSRDASRPSQVARASAKRRPSAVFSWLGTRRRTFPSSATVCASDPTEARRPYRATTGFVGALRASG